MRNLSYRLCVAAAGVLLPGTAAFATDLTATLTADNEFTAYISTDDTYHGNIFGDDANWANVTTHNVTLTPGVTNYLHVRADDWGPPAMLIGEFSLSDTGFLFTNGTQSLLTNTTDWRVSKTGFGSDYETPVDLGPNGGGAWGGFPAINGSARFIWAPGSPLTAYFSAPIIPTPEPATLTILLGGVAVLVSRRRRTVDRGTRSPAR